MFMQKTGLKASVCNAGCGGDSQLLDDFLQLNGEQEISYYWLLKPILNLNGRKL